MVSNLKAGRNIGMKKVLKIIIIIVVVALLAIDFYGLWKYKLSGKPYVLEADSGDDSASEETQQEEIQYEEITSTTLKNGNVLFIKNIEQNNENCTVKGVIYEPYEISKDDYNELKSGESVEILGTTYKKNKIKSNNMTLKSTDSSAKDYYINYDTSSQKYILKESKTDYTIYKLVDKNVKIDVAKGTVFATVKNGKTTTSKVEAVADTHSNIEAPEGETASINTCELTFNKNGTCTKITETVR